MKKAVDCESQLNGDSVSSVLFRVQDELDVLAEQTKLFQENAGSLIAPGHAVPGHVVSAIQSLDEITQKLECLSNYLSGISALAQDDWRLDLQTALASVSLAELKDRLSGKPLDGGQEPAPASECEFF